jgi:hypothetical protein
MKKRAVLVACLSAGALFSSFAVPNDVVYSEGDATVKYQEGYVDEVYIGDVYDTGDTVTTGYDGFVELDQDGLVLKINPDTVFTLQEKEEKGEKAGVFSVALGSIKFRYGRITGKEPMIQTPSCIAGVRGTEFSVFAGADGSALIVVDSGLVEVESEGKAVQLTSEEGVEVQPGEPPGDKFVVQRDQIDYKTWNDQKIEAMLADPVDALSRVIERMSIYVNNVNEYRDLYDDYRRRLTITRERANEIAEKEGKEASQRFNREKVLPLVAKANALYLNVRYFSLAALSLRRYVGSRLYMYVKSNSIADLNDGEYMEFKHLHDQLLRQFEDQIVPQLNELDI